jgi:hypothetical protein
MTTDESGALEALLAQTEAAHSVFEKSELNGVYDEAWPRWYAEYAVGHGIGALLGRPVTADQLARLLASSWDELQHADPTPTDTWAAYTARHIAAELRGT